MQSCCTLGPHRKGRIVATSMYPPTDSKESRCGGAGLNGESFEMLQSIPFPASCAET